MTAPILVTDPADLPGGRVALVPTMGALHQGHLSLVRLAKQHADTVVVSIFVNPTQFGPTEDFAEYPRTLDQDLQALAGVGADYVFAPSVAVMYPQEALVTIDPGPVAKILDGASRPGHFAGVCQVVSKLFNLVRPAVAVFGEKDAQQLAIIRQMVADLSYPIKIIGAPIVREADGLALSSRNAYLSDQDRQLAPLLQEALQLGRQAKTPAQQAATTEEFLREAGIVPEYVEVVQLPEFSLVTAEETPVTGASVLLLAARIGTTRLIDNLVMGEQ